MAMPQVQTATTASSSSTQNIVSHPLAKIINPSFEHNVPIETLGEGTLNYHTFQAKEISQSTNQPPVDSSAEQHKQNSVHHHYTALETRS